jgi:hypothetical protein
MECRPHTGVENLSSYSQKPEVCHFLIFSEKVTGFYQKDKKPDIVLKDRNIRKINPMVGKN